MATEIRPFKAVTRTRNDSFLMIYWILFLFGAVTGPICPNRALSSAIWAAISRSTANMFSGSDNLSDHSILRTFSAVMMFPFLLARACQARTVCFSNGPEGREILFRDALMNGLQMGKQDSLEWRAGG